ncbi:MAG: Fis family transcriptional regulator [Thermoanaerobaculia bacterium]|nr:MAG: Fis family transcriptional regulator [Thermoanaerobaculia bacterium]
MTVDALFTGPWAAALERELAVDEPYRRAAAGWNGSLLFVLEADPARGLFEPRRLFLDLAHGNARAVRPALPADEREARFHLVAPAAIWLQVLDGGLEPAAAVMSGRLRLERGSLFSLVPHLEAARRLLACARRVQVGAVALEGD